MDVLEAPAGARPIPRPASRAVPGASGRPPLRPKSLGVSTMPWPKWWCQRRLTITRAVSGLPGSAIHFARARRRCCSGASTGKLQRVAERRTSAPGAMRLALLHRIAAVQAIASAPAR